MTQPIAMADTAVVTVGATATGNLLANDIGVSLTVVSVNGIPVSGSTSVEGFFGTLTIGPDGAYSYVATDAGTDEFTYTISDGTEYSEPAVLTIEVEAAAPPADVPGDDGGLAAYLWRRYIDRMAAARREASAAVGVGDGWLPVLTGSGQGTHRMVITGRATAALPALSGAADAFHDPDSEETLTRTLLLACFPDHDPNSIVVWEGGGSISPR